MYSSFKRQNLNSLFGYQRAKSSNSSNSNDTGNSFGIVSFQYDTNNQVSSGAVSTGNTPSPYQLTNLTTSSNDQELGQEDINKDPIQEMLIDDEFLEEGFRPGTGMHSGDPLGSTAPGLDERDFGADSLLAWAKNNAKSPEEISLADRVDLANKNSNQERDKLEKFTDGQGIAALGSTSGTGLEHRDWFELVRMQGDQFIGLARAQAGSDLNPLAARMQARELLINRIKDYTSAGLTDGNLIGVLIGKGMSAEEFNSSDTEKARYKRYEDAKAGGYDWGKMTADLNEKSVNMGLVEQFTGIDKRNANLFTENLFYESYYNVDKMSKDLHYFKDKAVGFNLIFACDSSRDHNGALHMNHGSLTGLAADDKNPTIVLSPRNDADMKRMIFRLSFIPTKEELAANPEKYKDWLNKPLDQQESNLISNLANGNPTDRIAQFNAYLDSNRLEKNIGVANYMLKGHGWSGGIALFDNGSYSNQDRDIMALMGLSISAHVDQARIHQQSCSTAVGGERSNVGVGNDTINDFAPSTTKVVSVGANDIHWNGQGEHYQNISYINGHPINEGYITEKNYHARQGLNTVLRPEELKALTYWTKNKDGIIVKKNNLDSLASK